MTWIPRQMRTNEGSAVSYETAPVPAESTAGIELASATETVAAAKVKALETRAEGKAGRGRRLLLQKQNTGLMHCERASLREKSMRCCSGFFKVRLSYRTSHDFPLTFPWLRRTFKTRAGQGHKCKLNFSFQPHRRQVPSKSTPPRVCLLSFNSFRHLPMACDSKQNGLPRTDNRLLLSLTGKYDGDTDVNVPGSFSREGQ